MNNTLHSALTVAVVSAVTVILRFFAFIAFPEGKKIPKTIKILGGTLPYGIMGFLVVYCLKDITPAAYPFGLPEVISVVLVAALQIWKKNSLLSVLVGTACYMILVQAVF